jgi:GH15 family glucan-1,4-alpha-glucosidase
MYTFFYVDALARAGRLTEAELTFQKMFTYANHLGLYSEEIVDTIPALRPATVGYPAIDAGYW